ncbi:MAG: putative oxidoreductase [Verrucomicrobiales bacterium]|jgi:putative oxidoreductase
MSLFVTSISRLFFGSAIPTGVWANLGLLLLRLHVGLSMASGGLDKLPVPDWFVGQVSELGFPLPEFFAFAAAMAEFAGGVLLAFGLFTRPAAFFLAFTIGVAAFGFHQVTPILGLNITQVLFWSYVLFTFAGGGRYALDRLILRDSTESAANQLAPSKGGVLFATVLALTVSGFGLYQQLLTPEPRSVAKIDDDIDLNSVSLAGSFNDWYLQTNPMSLQKNGRWITTVELPKPGPIEFKFAANGTWDLNCGEIDQDSDELPLAGVSELNDSDDPENIRAFVPMAGTYQFMIDPEDFSYSLSKAETAVVDPEDLIGAWEVDLRPTPDAEPYFQTFVIETVEGDSLTGSFCNTAIQEGKIDTAWGSAQFTFVTVDGTDAYYTTGKLVDGRLKGTTHSPSLKLFSVWTATRAKVN